MNTPGKLGVFTLGLATAFALAFGAGRVAGPQPGPSGNETGEGHDTATDGHSGGTGTTAPANAMPGGLQIAQDGYRIEPLTPQLSTSDATRVAFRIVGPDGQPVTRYTRTHDKDLHLIVVRRDLSGFQHVHPTMASDGVWSVPLRAPSAGQYRLFADFQPAARDKGLTLGVDLPAPGDYRPTVLDAPSRTSTVDGYTVALDGDLVPGTSSKLTLTVSKDGVPVTDLQPYLAAYGHLVALRDGDLAYLHVHPDGVPGDGRTKAGPRIVFYAEVPSIGRYGLFLDFQHGGVVRTASFTANAGQTSPPAGKPTPTQPTPTELTPTQPTPTHGGHP